MSRYNFCIMTEGLSGWATASRYNDCIVTGTKAGQAGESVTIQ